MLRGFVGRINCIRSTVRLILMIGRQFFALLPPQLRHIRMSARMRVGSNLCRCNRRGCPHLFMSSSIRPLTRFAMAFMPTTRVTMDLQHPESMTDARRVGNTGAKACGPIEVLTLLLGVALAARTDVRAVFAPPSRLRQLDLRAPGLIEFRVCHPANLERSKQANPRSARIASGERTPQLLTRLPDRRSDRLRLIVRRQAHDVHVIQTRIEIPAAL